VSRIDAWGATHIDASDGVSVVSGLTVAITTLFPQDVGVTLQNNDVTQEWSIPQRASSSRIGQQILCFERVAEGCPGFAYSLPAAFDLLFSLAISV
jgi:hypothetical protein